MAPAFVVHARTWPEAGTQAVNMVYFTGRRGERCRQLAAELHTTYELGRTYIIRRLRSLDAFISWWCLARQTRLLSSVFWLDVVGILSSTKTGKIGRDLAQI